MYSELQEDINGSLSFDTSVVKIESENADTKGRMKGGKKIEKSSDLRKSLMDDVEIGASRNQSLPRPKKSLMEGHDDPYYVFRDDLLTKLDLVQDSLTRYESIIKNTVSRGCKNNMPCFFLLPIH